MADITNNVISSATLQPTPAIQPVTPTPDTTNYSGITGGVTQSIMDEYAALNAKQSAAQANQQATGTSITDLMKQLTGKTADTQAANDAAGVTAETANLNKYAQQLADLNAQASSLNRATQAIPIQTQERNRNTGATDAGVAPQTAGDLRLNALKALSIGQQSDIAAAAATGSNLRLQAAKDKAQQIIDLKYKPIEDEIALKQKQYDLNKDTLDSIDKKRSEALQLSLQKEAQDLADKKAKQKANAELSLQAGVKTQFMNKGGELSQVSDGTSFSNPVDFLKAAGIPISANPTPKEIQAGFAQAYQKGLITDVSGTTLQNITFAQQAQAKYGDAGILPGDSPETVAKKIKDSAIYKHDTTLASDNGFTLSAGQTRYDAKGNIIAGGGGSSVDLTLYKEQTSNGNSYINLDKLTKDEQASVTAAARQAGVPLLKTADISKLNAIDDTRLNLADIQNAVQGLLANNPGNNFFKGIENTLKGAAGSQGIKDYNAYRTAIINSVQALAGGAGSGLRINAAEIKAAMDNDLPVISGPSPDTVASAKGKLDKLAKQLDNWEHILVGNAKANQTPGGGVIEYNGKSYQTDVDGNFDPTKPLTMRTDRNNNPTAMTTDVAKSLGLKLGVDYVQGDKFPGDSNLYTAKLIGDPVAKTIAGLDNGGFYTASGQPRWTHTAIPQNQWNKLSYVDKVKVVQKMYKAEGGSALSQYFA